jgi:hypothetical protein
MDLKGLSHEIFEGVFLPLLIGLDQKRNPAWFLNFLGPPLIFGALLKFLMGRQYL